MEDIQDVSNSFLAIKTTLDIFEYSGSLGEKLKQLVQVVVDKDEDLIKVNLSLVVAQKYN